MKIESRQVEAFLKKPDPRVRGVVIYGNDDGLVAERAVASNDDHVIKLVYSCRAEAAVYGEGARRHAAALAVGG